MSGKTNLPKTNYLSNLKGFQDHLKQNRKRPETVSSYVNTTKTFLNLICKEPKNINKQDLIKWKDYCQKFHNNTLTPKYGAVKQYINFLIDKNLLKEEFYGIVLRTLKAPKLTRDKTNIAKLVLSPDQLQRLFDIAKKTNYMHYAIFKLAEWSALRRCEVLGLNISDIKWNIQSIDLRPEITKGGKPKLQWTSKEALDILKEYIEKFRITPSENCKDALFIYDSRRLSRTKLWEMVLQYRELAKLPGLHFHQIRHTGITEYARYEKDIEKVKDFARHDDINTTQLYINYARGEYEGSLKSYEESRTNKPEPTPLKKPEEPEVIKQKQTCDSTKNMYQATDVNYKIRQMELELANKQAEIELLKLRNEQKKYENSNNIYG